MARAPATSQVSADDVRDAATRLAGIAHRTPVATSAGLDERAGAQVFCKCENLQRAGAFKFRGAFHALSRLDPGTRARGVATYSSGNHGQAVALAARLFGAPATIAMPSDAPRSKADAVRGYGAEIVTYDRYVEDRVALGARLAGARGLTLVPPYDDPNVIAGQGTAALELLDEVGQLDVLLVPVGGGGLIAGCATIATALLPRIRVVGVEPVSGDDTKRSIERGQRVRIAVPHTIADGQAAETPGELTFAINKRLVDSVVLVSDDEIRDAMRFAFDRMKLVVEPSGASALAAVLSRRVPGADGRVGVVVSGGNVDANRFAEVVRAPSAGSSGPS